MQSIISINMRKAPYFTQMIILQVIYFPFIIKSWTELYIHKHMYIYMSDSKSHELSYLFLQMYTSNNHLGFFKKKKKTTHVMMSDVY